MEAAAEVWYESGVVAEACSSARAHVWEHQALEVDEHQNGARCLSLHARVWEYQTEAAAEDWYQTVVVVVD